MTIYEQLQQLAKEEVFTQMTLSAQKMVTNCLDGLDGLGDISNWDIREYITDKQIDYIAKIAKRYLKKEK